MAPTISPRARVTVTSAPRPPATTSVDGAPRPAPPAAGAPVPPPGGVGRRRPPDGAPRAPAAPTSAPRLPRVIRPAGLLPASRPGEVPEPQHKHLPGWARRIHAQARPILADLLGGLSGDSRDHFAGQVAEQVAGISAGRFSLAWQYPQLIDAGWVLVRQAARDTEAAARRRQAVEGARRRVGEQLRDAQGRMTSEAAARLQQSLRAAEDVETIRAVGGELDQALNAARSLQERRRDREIDRTRERLRRSLPQAAVDDGPAESWQDALRRIATQHLAE
jgi:hypothetical protein